MLRGGSWNNNPQNCRSAYRNRNNPDNRNNNAGFRLVLHFHWHKSHTGQARNPRVQGLAERGKESPGFGPEPLPDTPGSDRINAVPPDGASRSKRFENPIRSGLLFYSLKLTWTKIDRDS
jgi:hypothetical protein